MGALKHLKQIEAMEDPARFKFWLAGRRGGKTVAIVEDMLEGISVCPDGGEIFYVGPTNSDAMELIWEKLTERLDELGWKYDPKVSKQRINFSGRRKIYVIGAEKIRRIRGHKVFRCYLDEVAFFSRPLTDIWRAIRPALSDLRGRAIAATTPNGKGTDAYDFYLDIKNKADWKFFHWYTEDNPYIDAEEIEAAKAELDERSYNQEYRAGWESYEGVAYYSFDENVHEKPCDPLDLGRPFILCYDFNVNPTTIIICQKHGQMLQFKREYSQRRGSTEDTTRQMCEDFVSLLKKESKGNEDKYRSLFDSVLFKIRGDASGNAEKSNTGRSDYYYVRSVLDFFGFKYEMEVPSSNPPIIDRVKHVNGYLKAVDGTVRVQVDPACKELLRDFSSQETRGRIPSDANNLGHKADAAGYCIYWDFRSSSSKPQGTVEL